MRILVVEDEPGLNEIIVKKLAHERYSVDSCLNGLDAEDYLAAAEYDAVVLTLCSPGGTVWRCCAACARRERRRRCFC